ncbi:hypothetical protein OAG71_05130 [bacterium]|nr:hypothetical protein [bacterium]
MNTISIVDPAKRVAQVRNVLTEMRPMNGNVRRTVPARAVPSRNSLVVVASENRLTDSYRDWRFKTSQPKIWAHYSEEWNQSGKKWLLRQYALHLYLVLSPTEQTEVFAFHCEPGHEGETLVDGCKRGPHVHVSTAGCLAHAHIPLQFQNLEAVLADVDELTKFIAKAVQFVDVEILPRFS